MHRRAADPQGQGRLRDVASLDVHEGEGLLLSGGQLGERITQAHHELLVCHELRWILQYRVGLVERERVGGMPFHGRSPGSP